MTSTTFTNFRKQAATYLNKVENGDTVLITRHGVAVAELTTPRNSSETKSWKKPALRLKLKGFSLSKELLEDRKKSRS